ncbi:hypothetical protein, partial [Brevibacterium sp. HMSC08F02]|uniref:hypothetical protein n=1 Tax=Brevibacterium sp. HMSC08F02 TaxID=1581140 RepID=UPI001C405828
MSWLSDAVRPSDEMRLSAFFKLSALSGWCDQATLNARFHVMECSYAYLLISVVWLRRVAGLRGGKTPVSRNLRFS